MVSCTHIQAHNSQCPFNLSTHTNTHVKNTRKHAHQDKRMRTKAHVWHTHKIQKNTSSGKQNGYVDPTESRTIGRLPKPGKTGLISAENMSHLSVTSGRTSHTRWIPPLFSPHDVVMFQSGFWRSAGAKRRHSANFSIWRESWTLYPVCCCE